MTLRTGRWIFGESVKYHKEHAVELTTKERNLFVLFDRPEAAGAIKMLPTPMNVTIVSPT